MFSRFAVVVCFFVFSSMLNAAPISEVQARIASDLSLSKYLEMNGRSCERAHIVVRVMDGELNKVELDNFCNLAEAGVVEIRRYLGEALDQAGGNDSRVIFNLSNHVQISHASIHEDYAHVYISANRIRQDTAPYLHEAVHVMALLSRGKATWLSEGFAQHVASVVAKRSGGYHFSPSEPRGLNSLAEHLQSVYGKELLPIIGVDGGRDYAGPEVREKLSLLSSQRRQYAPAYYTLSWAFVAYIVSKIGLHEFHLVGQCKSPSKCLSAITGLEIDQLRAEWIQSVGEI